MGMAFWPNALAGDACYNPFITNTVNTAIYFHPEAYTTTGPKLMGRNAAGESFLRGFFAHSHNSELWVQVEKIEHAKAFAHAAQAAGRTKPVKVIDKSSLVALRQPGVVYYPGSGIGVHARKRGLVGATADTSGHCAWSLCGITHTTSSAVAMDALVDLLIAPVQPWDAVICTSHAVKGNVEKLLQAEADYLVQRMGAQRLVLPQLPVIPLGIHTADFYFTPEQKAQARSAVGADAHTLVVLYTGRLSFHAKAHPLAMYQALESAARRLAPGQKLLLVECGWHANEYIAHAYTEAARLACPSVQVRVLDGRDSAARNTAWACADVFCSLSDNIQETFGIVPIEAMAAGLPVVVSDWDGYKDTVRDGVDGYRIRTLQPQSGLGADLAVRHALDLDTYDMYCGHACSLVAVDVQATAAAFGRLFASADLRRTMGEAGQQRARRDYDWTAIIARYETLWAQQNDIRLASQQQLKPLPNPWPARMDPFHAFGNYPSHVLGTETVLRLVDASPDVAIRRVQQYQQLAMVNFAKVVLPSNDDMVAILTAASNGPCPAGKMIQSITPARQAQALRTIGWLAKLGVLAWA